MNSDRSLYYCVILAKSPKFYKAPSEQEIVIKTSFKDSQNQNVKIYKNGDVLLLGYAPVLGIIW